MFLVQGWIVGVEGFSQSMGNAIVLAEALDAVWMVWLLVVAWRMQGWSLVASRIKASVPPPSSYAGTGAALAVEVVRSGAPPQHTRNSQDLWIGVSRDLLITTL